MLNHARTLLLNAAADPTYATPGEEFVPAEFVPAELPTYLRDLRAQLFGADPDRLTLNYRLSQYMTLLHSTELAEYVTNLDSRLTYDVAYNLDLFTHAFDRLDMQQIGGDNTELSLGGTYTPPGDLTGRCRHDWMVEVVDDNTVKVTTLNGVPHSNLQDFTLTGQLSSPISLTGTGLTFQFTVPGGWPVAENPTWTARVDIRPARDPGELAASLSRIGEPTLLQLFGVGKRDQDPLPTFRRLWNEHKELPYRLGGLLLAVIYQTDRLRRTL